MVFFNLPVGEENPDPNDPNVLTALTLEFRVFMYDCTLSITIPADHLDFISQPAGEASKLSNGKIRY